MSTVAVHPFLVNRDAVAARFGRHRSILTHDAVTWPDEQPGAYRGRFHRPELIRFAHLDLSLTGDATGVVVGCVSGFDRVRRGENTETLPRVRVDFALQVHPPRGGEIPFEKIRSMIYKLRDLGLNIRHVSADTYQSADTLQLLYQQGLVTSVRSIDRDPRPYDVLKTALYDGRVEIPAHDALLGELLALERDARTGRVDHPPHGSKDLADALAGVVYGLTMRCDVWWQHEVNPFEEAPEIAARVTLYGRRNRAA